MAEVLLFHHAQGRTPGVLTFADALRAGGHTVHVRDFYGGKTFSAPDEGVPSAKQVDPGDRHLFAESSLADYDESAAELLEQRTLEFLGEIE